MGFILSYQWEIFIALEILSIIALLLFGFVRYLLNQSKLSMLFIGAFLAFLFIEVFIALLLYKHTGEISTFQIVIAIFVLYACTFGIVDFIKLDRWMRSKIGAWHGIELLTEKDYLTMERNKDPKYLARKYRRTSTVHLIIFVIVQAVFWSLGTENLKEMVSYARDLSWIQTGTAESSPYPNDTIYSIGMIWGIVFIVDFIWSWSYTFFPSKK